MPKCSVCQTHVSSSQLVRSKGHLACVGCAQKGAVPEPRTGRLVFSMDVFEVEGQAGRDYTVDAVIGFGGAEMKVATTLKEVQEFFKKHKPESVAQPENKEAKVLKLVSDQEKAKD